MDWLKALQSVPESTIMELISGGMSYGAYQNIAKTFISEGIGWAQATGIMRNYLPDFDGSTFGDVYYNRYQTEKQREQLFDLNPYDNIDKEFLIERSLSQPVNYRYLGEFTYINDITGEKEKEYKSFYSNDLMSVAEAGAFLFDTFDIESYEQWRQIESVRVVNIEHNTGWDY